jgi:YesN/AraC family two-component response regulator
MKYYLDNEGIPYIIGVGISVAEIPRIRESYRMALFAVQCGISKKANQSVIFSTSIDSTDTFLYSPQVELQLIGNIKSGSVVAAKHILDSVYTRNFEENVLKPHVMKCLLYNLYGTYLKVSHTLFDDNDDFAIFLERNDGDYTTVFNKLHSSLIEVAKQYEKRKKSHNTSMIQKIIDYLEEHYQDPDLDVIRVADEFHITGEYLSLFFKEQTGINFLAYLINLRMHKAKDLLTKKTMSIEEIAGSVGYRDVHSFRRAFKRVVGTSPSAYSDVPLETSDITL